MIDIAQKSEKLSSVSEILNSSLNSLDVWMKVYVKVPTFDINHVYTIPIRGMYAVDNTRHTVCILCTICSSLRLIFEQI